MLTSFFISPIELERTPEAVAVSGIIRQDVGGGLIPLPAIP
ncbi:hypothetical protein ACFLV0_06040 [Chloroflexota bacterium]